MGFRCHTPYPCARLGFHPDGDFDLPQVFFLLGSLDRL